MTSPADTAQHIRTALEPFVRPRDEAAHIRRVLRAHLAAAVGGGLETMMGDAALGSSLALVDQTGPPPGASGGTGDAATARGLQRQYLRALQANRAARAAWEEEAVVPGAGERSASSAPAETRPVDADANANADADADASLLQEHLAMIRLQRKRERLRVVQRYLDALGERPVAVAAGEDYLQPEFIYGDATRTLPAVPQAVVEGIAHEPAAAAAAAAAAPLAAVVAGDLDRLAARVEKAVLRARLAQRQEEVRRAAAKARAGALAGRVTAAARLQALGTARDALIAWMETELSNAGDKSGGEDDDDDDDDARRLRQSLLGGGDGGDGPTHPTKTARLEARLAEIRAAYARYVAARAALVATVGRLDATRSPGSLPATSQPPPETKDRTGSREAAEAARQAARGTATAHLLLAPSLARLLAVARDQKADIAHKAHYNVLLAKRLKDACQLLDRLADESQLLPRHGGGAQADRRRGAKTGLLAAGGGRAPEGPSQRVAAWTEAAEAAKLATFEAVVEQVEGGREALEAATQALDEADRLLGRTAAAGDGQHETNDIWAALDGALGLLNRTS